MSASHAEALSDLRLRLLANGYEPVPIIGPDEQVKSAGKRPRLPEWQSVEITPPKIRGWAREYSHDTNTGIRCGQILGVDIDVLNAEVARSIEDLAIAMLGPTPLRRIGRAPKLLLAYRAVETQAKAETPEFILPDGTKAQVEVLAKGQQFVSHGVHPDTRQAYVWTAQAPETVPVAQLPVAQPARIRAFLAAAESLLRDAGAQTAQAEKQRRPDPAPQRPAQATRAPGAEGGFFRAVNDRALAHADLWVKSIFPRAYWQPNAATPPGAWRVASKDLGRGLEEDIAIHVSQGCQDFGTRESLTPIDLVMRHGGAADAPQAALWLCDRLSIDPAALGWHGRKGPQLVRRVTEEFAPPEPPPRDEAPPDWEPDPTPVIDQQGSQPNSRLKDEPAKPGLPLVYFNEIQPSLAADDFIEGLLIKGAMSVIYGPSNCGKTFWTSDLALHVATGRKWQGRDIEPVGVIYCALEGAHGISNRVAAWRKHYRLDGVEVPFAIIPVTLNLLDPDQDASRVVDAIQAAAKEFGIPVGWVIMDTLSRAMAGGNENSPEDMGALVTNGTLIQQATGSHLTWIHHSGKDQAQGARGHSLLRAATDTEIEINRPDKDSPSVARVTKQRELEIDGEWVFTLKTVELGKNRRGKPVTSCIVEPVEGEAPVAKRQLSKGQAAALSALREAVINCGKPGTRDMPRDIRCVPVETWRKAFYSRSHLDTPEAKKKAFQRGVADLVANRLVGILDDHAWLAEGKNDRDI